MELLTKDIKPSIFEFGDYREFLKAACFPNGKYNHTSGTLSIWAKKLGYKSPSSLTMVLNGDRVPSRDMINSLGKELKLTSKERQYLDLQVDLERTKRKGKDPSDVLKRMSVLAPGKNSIQLNLNQFSLISKWYFYVIKQLINSPGFIEDYDWMFKRLDRKVTPSQIRYAIDALQELGLVTRDAEGKLISSEKGVISPNDIPSSALKNHHTGMMERAVESLRDKPVEERQITSLTYRMNPQDLEKAKDRVFKFIQEFNEEFSTDSGSEVFQLNAQLFSHTKKDLSQ
ncbi:MAG: DUF4423 domain-containing protein [Bacteriovoracaceae bacterium]|nr:DUF4423 domain-containing protein [Bacteriovoracaceae bacterium]